MVKIINDVLPWDGAHLGDYLGTRIIQEWKLDGKTYKKILLDENSVIYCMSIILGKKEDLFQCIVEDIKKIFNIKQRGIHRIKIDEQEYILYYVPINENGELIWETPLNKIDNKHVLRNDQLFKYDVQKIIAFCDILALSNTEEKEIIIRPGENNQYIPINTNTKKIELKQTGNGIVPGSLFLKWFGEHTDISNIVKEMVNYNGDVNKLALLSTEVRDKIDKIIKKYDNGYAWYSNFIIDRLLRYLLTS